MHEGGGSRESALRALLLSSLPSHPARGVFSLTLVCLFFSLARGVSSFSSRDSVFSFLTHVRVCLSSRNSFFFSFECVFSHQREREARAFLSLFDVLCGKGRRRASCDARGVCSRCVFSLAFARADVRLHEF